MTSLVWRVVHGRATRRSKFDKLLHADLHLGAVDRPIASLTPSTCGGTVRLHAEAPPLEIRGRYPDYERSRAELERSVRAWLELATLDDPELVDGAGI